MSRNILSKLNLKAPITLSIAVNILIIIALIVLSSRIPPVVPLFYGKPPGEEQLAAPMLLLIPPVLALVFVAINVILSRGLRDKFLRNALTGASLVATALSSITIVRITFLVGNL